MIHRPLCAEKVENWSGPGGTLPGRAGKRVATAPSGKDAQQSSVRCFRVHMQMSGRVTARRRAKDDDEEKERAPRQWRVFLIASHVVFGRPCAGPTASLAHIARHSFFSSSSFSFLAKLSCFCLPFCGAPNAALFLLLPMTIAEREAGGEAKVGQPAAGQAAQGHNARVPRGLCAEHNGQETGHVRPLQSGPERQNAADRLPSAS